MGVQNGGPNGDTLTGGPDNDQLSGNGGDDKLLGLGGDDTLDGGIGNDKLDGGAGHDTLNGGAGNDILYGGLDSDVLTGDVGDDWLDGGSGADKMSGGAGNDVYIVNATNDQVTELANQGRDEVHSIAALTKAFDNVEDYLFTGSVGLHFTANALNNTITATGADDVIAAGSGNDVVSGNGGNDVLHGEDGNDRLNGGAGNDTLTGDAGIDVLDGGGGADKLDGGDGSDRLVVEDLTFAQAFGGVGQDTLQFVGSGFTVDLGLYAGTTIRDIEQIDLSQSGKDDLILSKAAVESVSSEGNRLIVGADAGDVVHLDAAFKQIGAQVFGGETYVLYKSGGDTVLIDQAATVYRGHGITDVQLSALDGHNGFTVTTGERQSLGGSVSAIGDVNGDGYDDFMVGAPGASHPSSIGSAYVLFGGPVGSAATLDVDHLTPAQGFRIDPRAGDHNFGISGSGGGDFNGDGIADLIVGTVPFDNEADQTGAAYVLFGSTAGFADPFETSTLTATQGFAMTGATSSSFAGYAVGFIGDVNGDGYDDVAVTAINERPSGNTAGGATYIVYGHAGPAGPIALADLPGHGGFEVFGHAPESAGRSISAAGDVNGDGIADFVVGNYESHASTNAAYVVFGTTAGVPALLDLATLDGSNGFALQGHDTALINDVSSAGDVNGDGYDDLIIGNGLGGNGGTAYVVFGHGGPFDATIDLGTLDGNNGFAIKGSYNSVDGGEFAGWRVSGAGDINGDGYADLLVGAPLSSKDGLHAGGAYVIYGGGSGFDPLVDLAALDHDHGFRIDGINAYEQAGKAVSAAGDVNGDGFADILVSTQYPNAVEGEAYVIYGGDFRGEVTHAGATGNDILNGSRVHEIFVGGTGNDVMNGGGGGDVFHGGSGDDHIHVADRSFRLADGGNGTDTLHLDFAGAIDLGNIDGNAATSDHGKIAGIEVLSIDNGKNNDLALHAADVLDLEVQNHDVGGVAAPDNTLKIDGNAGDTLSLSAADHWSAADTSALAGYAVYTAGAVKIAVDTDIHVTTA